MRYLLIVALLAGCSAALPTTSQRDTLRSTMFSGAVAAGVSTPIATCIASAVDKMSAADVEKSYSAIMAGGAVGSVPELAAAVNTCRPQ